MDLPINTIADLFSESHPENVIGLILEQQEQTLNAEISQRREKLDKLVQLQRELKGISSFSVESIHDIAYMMENKNKLKKLRGILLLVGIPLDIAEIAALAVWIFCGIWWPFVLWLCVDLILGLGVISYYTNRVEYICPECHRVFRVGTKQQFFAKHTPTARKLTCTCCGYKGFCVETYGGKMQ